LRMILCRNTGENASEAPPQAGRASKQTARKIRNV